MQFQQNTTVPLPVPSIISNPATGQTWLVSHQIGKGGFSQVFQIVDRATSAHYAAKIVSKSFLSSNEHLFRKLKSEIAINSSLSHPNIVQFICCFEDALNFYLVLELCPNGTLLEMIQRKKRIAQKHVQRFTANALDALEYLHGRGIIHRDVKLGNLFVDGEFRVKLGDFGLSVPLSHQGERKKTLCGTPNYIAPEVIRKEGYSFEVDIWSLGIVVYTLLVGRAPFICASGTSEELCKVILECSIDYPRELLSSSAISLLKGMLQKDPLDRITIKEMRVHPFFENCEGKENVENQIVTGKGREKEGKFTEKEGKFTEKEGKMAEKIIQGKLAERSPLGKLTEQPPLTAKTIDPSRNQSINLQIHPQLFGKNPVESSENILNAPLQPKNIPLNTTPQKNSTLIETIANNLALLLGDCKASIKSPTSSYSKHSLPIHIVRLNESHHKKYGIFYQLSDASIGAFFNDHPGPWVCSLVRIMQPQKLTENSSVRLDKCAFRPFALNKCVFKG